MDAIWSSAAYALLHPVAALAWASVVFVVSDVNAAAAAPSLPVGLPMLTWLGVCGVVVRLFRFCTLYFL